MNYPFLTLKERDVETGLDYFLARYYSSVQGRFTSPDEFKGGPEELFGEVDPHDPLFYSDTAEPQSLNKYQYCLNNPLRYIDPDGHQTATADALKIGAALTVAAPHPVAKVVGVGILVGVGVEVTLGWKNVGRGVKALLDQGGQSAMQQDLEDLRLLRQGDNRQAVNRGNSKIRGSRTLLAQATITMKSLLRLPRYADYKYDRLTRRWQAHRC